MLKEEYSIDDFEEADFLNPISLLAALQKLSLREGENAQDESTCDFLTVADIQRQYGLSEDCVRSALLAGSLSPSKMILYFSKSDVEDLVSKMSEAPETNPLIAAFEKELDKMVMNYSYKPLLLLALFSKESLSAKVEEIIDFYFEYYSGRAEKGQVVEKGDSSFIQNPGDRFAARRTILRYPVSVLAKKCFVVYDKEHDTVSVNSLLVNDRQHINAAYVQSRCMELLDKYYYTAE